MKTITTQEYDLILSARSEGLTVLPPGVLEKDLLLTEVLHSIHNTDKEGIRLVFCGGTCLSKGHGLIDRMSEDIDFKLVTPQDLSRSARSRRLSQYKKRLASDFEQMGFYVPADEIVARDENSYVSMNLHYKSRFSPVASLRTEIKVELNARPPVLPTTSLPIRSLLSTLTQEPIQGIQGIQGTQGTQSLPIECIGIEETLAEKILSFLRRSAEVRAGRNRGAYDNRLVRHLYDVKAIAGAKHDIQLSRDHFAMMVAGDALQYRNQYPEFEQDAVGQMRSVMQSLQNESSSFEQDYAAFVDELVFGEPVSYTEAKSVFIDLAEQLISALPTPARQ